MLSTRLPALRGPARRSISSLRESAVRVMAGKLRSDLESNPNLWLSAAAVVSPPLCLFLSIVWWCGGKAWDTCISYREMNYRREFECDELLNVV